MNKSFFIKHKKIIWSTLAVILVLSIFFIKTKSVYQNKAQETGLSYGNETVAGFVDKDTDGDGVYDWEESIWGTDPTKKDTNDDGIPDSADIAKKKATLGKNKEVSLQEGEENLNETEKFSRELFSTVAALNQTGPLDQSTVDKLSTSLAERIENPITKKVFGLNDLKVTDSTDVKSYSNSLDSFFKKYPILFKDSYPGIAYSISEAFLEVMQKFMNNTDDDSAFVKLDPIIKELNGIIGDMTKMNVPSQIAIFHLNILNGFERILENLNDIKLVNKDTIVAMGAANKYQENIDLLQGAIMRYRSAITQQVKQ